MISSRIRNKIYEFLRLSAPETQQPHRGRQRELKKKAKNADLGCYKFKMPNKCSCEHDSAKKGKGRRQRTRSLASRGTSAEKQCAKKTGKNPFGKEDRPPFRSYKKGNCGCDRECAYWHPSHCKYFKMKNSRL